MLTAHAKGHAMKPQTPDYFEDKMQNVVECAISALLTQWKNLNPYEPSLQAHLESRAIEFLNHVRSHSSELPSECFALGGWDGQDDRLRLALEISRKPSVWTETELSAQPQTGPLKAFSQSSAVDG